MTLTPTVNEKANTIGPVRLGHENGGGMGGQLHCNGSLVSQAADVPLSHMRARSDGSIMSCPLGSSNCSGPVHLNKQSTPTTHQEQTSVSTGCCVERGGAKTDDALCTCVRNSPLPPVAHTCWSMKMHQSQRATTKREALTCRCIRPPPLFCWGVGQQQPQ